MLNIISKGALLTALILIVVGGVLTVKITVSEEISESMAILSTFIPVSAMVFNTISLVAEWKRNCMPANDADEK